MKLPSILYDSVHAYEDILKVDSNNVDALVGIVSALNALKRYDEAINYYDQVLSLDQNNKNTLFNLWIKLGNHESTISSF